MANSLTSCISLLKCYLLNEANPDTGKKEGDYKHSYNLTIKLKNIRQKEDYYVISFININIIKRSKQNSTTQKRTIQSELRNARCIYYLKINNLMYNQIVKF